MRGARLLGWTVVASLCVAAFTAIIAILSGDFDDTDGRVIATSVVFGVSTAVAGSGASLRYRDDGALRALGRAEAARLTGLRHRDHLLAYLNAVKRTEAETGEARGALVLVDGRPGPAIQAARRFHQGGSLVVAEVELVEPVESLSRWSLAHGHALEPLKVFTHWSGKLAYNLASLAR